MALIAALTSAANASVTVNLGQTENANGWLFVPVEIGTSASDNVAGLQFDVHFDPSQMSVYEVQAGIAAANAGKEVAFSETDDGTLRVLVTGFNQDAMADGEAVVLVMEPYTGESTPDALRIDSIVASDPYGGRIVLNAPATSETDTETPPNESASADEAPETADSGTSSAADGESSSSSDNADAPSAASSGDATESTATTQRSGVGWFSNSTDSESAAQHTTASSQRGSAGMQDHYGNGAYSGRNVRGYSYRNQISAPSGGPAPHPPSTSTRATPWLRSSTPGNSTQPSAMPVQTERLVMAKYTANPATRSGVVRNFGAEAHTPASDGSAAWTALASPLVAPPSASRRGLGLQMASSLGALALVFAVRSVVFRYAPN